MENILTERRKKSLKRATIGSIFISILIVLVSIAIVAFMVSVNINYKETTATISNIVAYEDTERVNDRTVTVTKYKIYIDYEVDDKEYENVLYDKTKNSDNKIGDKIKILYDTRDHLKTQNPSYKSFSSSIIAFSVLAIFTYVSINNIFYEKKLYRDIEKLKADSVVVRLPLASTINRQKSIKHSLVFIHKGEKYASRPISMPKGIEVGDTFNVYFDQSQYNMVEANQLEKVKTFYIDLESWEKKIEQ